MITTQEIYAHLRTMTKEELTELNHAVVHEVKWKRKQDTADKKRTLKVGMKVSWNGKHGYTTGKITDLRRTKADVLADDGQRWECSISMLTKLPTFDPSTGVFE